jgi:hypothetical protein
MATKTETQTVPSLVTVLRTARADLEAFVTRGIDLAEKRTKAAFRFARALSKRIGGTAKKSAK